jgi:transaldolase/glucose-6-phosphate isomerase
MSENIPQLTRLGQSLWYDNIERRLLENGELGAMIARGEIRGVTSNPSIFKNAIANSSDYDTALLPMAWSGWEAERIFWQLAVEDIQAACDLFRPLYDETNCADGYVSLEVSPYLAHDTEGTVEQVRVLWERVDHPNLMVKIPATPQGIPAIRRSIAAGINVNVTLIFSLERYAEVMEAYLSGLEDRLAEGHALDKIASVASFFVSRVDTKVDKRLPETSPLRGQAAVANARLAYEAFLNTFTGPRWEALQEGGAHLQRPLWASTSTKNPAYPDTLYVDSLIGADTVNTVPPQTLEAFRDNTGLEIRETITEGVDKAREHLAALEEQGVAMAQVTQELENEGVKAFADAFSDLLATIEERRLAALTQLGPLATSLADKVAELEAHDVAERLWAADAALWTEDPAGGEEVKVRLGWLHLPETSRSLLDDLESFTARVHKEGVRRVLLLGMGGSSLAPEVLSDVFAALDPQSGADATCLSILDSTDPAQVRGAAEDFPPGESLYLVSSKSGGTAEVMAMLEYFWELSGGNGARFVAITDPGSPLEALARERGFRQVFLADPHVGGRYSALTAFGLVPGALLGLDLERLLARAGWMMAQSKKDVPAGRNPGLVLGALLGVSAQNGRDKLTILADESLAPLGSWLEQLIAESSGKDGKGILPVDREPPGEPSVYGADRLFVYLRQVGEQDELASELRAAGHPVLVLEVTGAYDLGAEFYRWEQATAVACHILGVNAFDQPDVEGAKVRARARVAQFQKGGQLEVGDAVPFAKAGKALRDFLGGVKDGEYIALNAFLPRQEAIHAALQNFRVAIREGSGCATTLGFGPRYLHSTGQLHKGGSGGGSFLVITADPQDDIEIPTQGLTFGTLQHAQALGDLEALEGRGRRVLHVHLEDLEQVKGLRDLVFS